MTGQRDTSAPLHDCIHGHLSSTRRALTLFSKRLLQQVVLHAHLGIHPLKPPVLFDHVLHLSNQKSIHSTKLGPTLIKTRAAHPMLPTQLGNGHSTPASFKMLIICASLYRPVFIKNLLRYLTEKILLLNTTNLRRDYHMNRRAKALRTCISW